MCKELLDVNLGHNYLADSKYPGIMVYGEEKEKDYKIAVLGGSTTDGAMYPFKSWPQLLYEELDKRNITIYNGGVRGYSSGQELIKLIRDILPLKPDMVIVYDGINETGVNIEYPFSFEYVCKVFEYGIKHMENNYIIDSTKEVCKGVKCNTDCFDNWLSNMQNIYAITRLRNIAFLGFCQPWLSSKRGKTKREKNMLLSMPGVVLDSLLNKSFRKQMEQRKDFIPDYIHDLSNIFDGENVYMDLCHVWEEGNQIIAKEIKKVVLQELELRDA